MSEVGPSSEAESNVALITGAGGQDGTYLVQRLVQDGWNVYGTVTHGSVGAVQALPSEAHLIEVDVADSRELGAVVASVAPQIVFHLAAESSVAKSWDAPTRSFGVNALPTLTLLAACRAVQESTGSAVTFVNASSSEIFAGSGVALQAESTCISPVSPYGAAKAAAHMLTQVYRSFGLVAINAILFNHESPRRPPRFVTRKITRAVAEIVRNEREELALGDMSIRRDWGWAPDYVDAMYKMALRGVSDDYVVATGRSHSIQEFVAAAFQAAGIADWRDHVAFDAALTRKADALDMRGDATKAAVELGWRPTVDFEELVRRMVSADLEMLRQGSE